MRIARGVCPERLTICGHKKHVSSDKMQSGPSLKKTFTNQPFV
jgi:hypothetical protein